MYTFAGLPVVVMGGRRFGQTTAVLRMLGAKLGYYNTEDADECYASDQVCDGW